MAEYTFDGAYGAPASVKAASLAHWLGAAASVALVVGVGVWGYKVMARDVSGVPVVMALAGPMREAPVDPGGTLADHRGAGCEHGRGPWRRGLSGGPAGSGTARRRAGGRGRGRRAAGARRTARADADLAGRQCRNRRDRAGAVRRRRRPACRAGRKHRRRGHWNRWTAGIWCRW
ncbi:hypothetical protein [Ponticoccus litoralis]|uniref:Uncharacterized protein n=1 Tax=Ponticoccus litoralis TaxID=422297 RepID=A0AAW9SSE1_9RHOB